MDMPQDQMKRLANARSSEIGTLKMRSFVVGRLLQGQVQQMFSDVVDAGGQVTWNSVHRGWFETTYYGLKIKGTATVMRSVVRYINQITSD